MPRNNLAAAPGTYKEERWGCCFSLDSGAGLTAAPSQPPRGNYAFFSLQDQDTQEVSVSTASLLLQPGSLCKYCQPALEVLLASYNTASAMQFSPVPPSSSHSRSNTACFSCQCIHSSVLPAFIYRIFHGSFTASS